MSRPSQNLDKLLIEVGKQMICEGGISDLSIRQLCSRAGVNPGMFKYHFDNRVKFLRIVHDELYDEFFNFIQDAADQEEKAVDKLRSCLLAMAKKCREETGLFAALLRDHINGKLEEILPKEEMVPKDLMLILQLINASKSEGSICPEISEFQAAALLIPSTLIPILIEKDFQEITNKSPSPIGQINFSSEKACTERLDIVLKGLKP